MDKVYKADLPRHRQALLDLKREFARVDPATDWTALRIDPLLEHVTSLERLLRSARFSRESARLRKGVGLFHADLIYLRANIKVLKDILAGEIRRSAAPKAKHSLKRRIRRRADARSCCRESPDETLGR